MSDFYHNLKEYQLINTKGLGKNFNSIHKIKQTAFKHLMKIVRNKLKR